MQIMDKRAIRNILQIRLYISNQIDLLVKTQWRINKRKKEKP